jgi:hypothetical protein
MALINDGSLVGFWPLNEPSGAPSWKNFSPAYAGHPSGVTFDLHVHTADIGTIPDNDSAASPWPSTKVIHNAESGTLIKGLQLLGENQKVTAGASAPFAKMLILGNGTRVQRSETLGPAVAGSGFTAGFWVYPNSDGWLNAATEGGFTPSVSLDSWVTGYGRTHSLMGQFRDDIGWFMGVSGALSNSTPDTVDEFGPHQLRAFLVNDVVSGPNPRMDTPIETGRYTHISMSYEYVDGTSNVISFYKEGQLIASETTDSDIVFDNNNLSGPEASVLNIGGGSDGTSSTDTFRVASGWGHLVSGAYIFRRVLSAGEISDLHNAGGLQPDLELRNDTTEVLLTDSNLIAHIHGDAPGWIDSSKNHYSFAAENDPGEAAVFMTWDPGPFFTNRGFIDGTALHAHVVAPSGATFDLASANGGFTICAFIQPIGTDSQRDESMMISMGSVSTTKVGPATPASVTGGATLGMVISYFDDSDGDKITLEAFPLGHATDGISLRASGEQIFRATNHHIGIVYDEASKGLALYIDGYQASSGNLSHNLQDQLLKLAGSGFPVMFMNGITNQIEDNNTFRGVHADGGRQGTLGSISMFSRPLEPNEMRFMAQSGINVAETKRTRNDPRLMGYWPCDTVDNSDVIAEDKARSMSPLLGHLARGDSSTKWARVYGTNQDLYRDDGTSYVDPFFVRTTPPELSSFGNLGITSGNFSPQGASAMGGSLSENADSSNTPFNANARWRPATEQRDLLPQNLHEYILSFEVTPSGDIPIIDATAHGLSSAQHWFNSKLHVHGNLGVGTADGEVTSFLTTQNASGPDPLGFDAGTGASGVTICFVGRDGSSNTAITPIVSGNLPYGVPSKVLFHAKFDEPYRLNEYTLGSAPMTVSLWVDGSKVNQRTDTATRWRLWSDQAPDGTLSDWPLQFGGYASTDDGFTGVNADSGLGEIYMREIFLMRGIFADDEIESLASDGIQSTLPTGYDNQLPTTTVTIADSNLEGYWRFNGFDGNIGEVSNSPGGSGTTDTSFKGNHLDAIAQRFYEQGTSVDMAEQTRVIPGPLSSSDLGIRCSGFHIASSTLGSDSTSLLPPFAVSGSAFDAPADGFSVGFFMAKRAPVASLRFDCILSYGILTNTLNGSSSETTLDPNHGWAIGMDDGEQMKMVISTGGNMFLDNASNAAYSGQLTCGTTRTGSTNNDLRQWNNYEAGDYVTPGIDYWDHYCWVYNPAIGGSGLRCYVNSVLVDEKFILPENSPWIDGEASPQTPVTPEVRMMTVRSHQRDIWDFRQTNVMDFDSVITDLFYFSRPITEPEVRHIVFNGISSITGTVTSGIVGGFTYGQDTGSGLIGGQVYGQDTGSGLIGGQALGAILSSGFIGGFVSGLVVGQGTIGGLAYGSDVGSGLIGGLTYGSDLGSGFIGGHIYGQDLGSGFVGGYALGANNGSGFIGGQILGIAQGSGIVGGFVLGGLSGSIFFDATYTLLAQAAQEFDGIVQIATTDSTDFDAKAVVFQSECPPVVTIPTPFGVSGLNVPFDQYFIGKVEPQQGKTITQAKWTFSDFTGDFVVEASGGNCYPISHTFSQSGFYIARLSAIDSDGVHGASTVFVNASSGVNPVIISLSGIPQIGEASLDVDFSTTVNTLPPGVIISAKLLTFDDGQSTISSNPSHSYTEPGKYAPIWYVRDSRGFIWSDSLRPGDDRGNL